MNLTPILADISWPTVVGGVGAVIFVLFIFVMIWASRYTKAGPNQVLIISGSKRRLTDPEGNVREVGFRAGQLYGRT